MKLRPWEVRIVMPSRFWPLRLVAAVVVLASSTVSFAQADGARCDVITRENVARCAVLASPDVRAEREAAIASAGRRVAAAPWFPSNPTLSLSAAHRAGTEGRGGAIDYYASLSQEVEIAGERAARRRSADADVAARTLDAAGAARRMAARAYVAYFDVVAAKDALAVAQRVETIARAIARVAAARAEAGVGSQLDVEVVAAASLRAVQGRLAAERDVRVRSATLAGLVGRDPAREVPLASGTLEPLAGSDALVVSASTSAVRARPEVRARESDRRAFEEQARALRRARVPTLTLQVFAQNDGYDERVLGGGLSFPLPLPQPLGRLYTGEIAEAEARGRQSAARADAAFVELATDLASAVATYETRRAEADLFTRDRALRAGQLMDEIGKEIEAGRLLVREAIVAQRELVDVLRGHVETRRAVCLASVDLALAAGVPLEGASR